MCILAFLYFVTSSGPVSGGFGWTILSLRRRHFFYICTVCIYVVLNSLLQHASSATASWAEMKIEKLRSWLWFSVQAWPPPCWVGFRNLISLFDFCQATKKTEKNQIRKIFKLVKFLSTTNVKVWTKAFELSIQTSWSLGVRPTPVNSWIFKGSNPTKV